jgi:hypothetical protein
MTGWCFFSVFKAKWLGAIFSSSSLSFLSSFLNYSRSKRVQNEFINSHTQKSQRTVISCSLFNISIWEELYRWQQQQQQQKSWVRNKKMIDFTFVLQFAPIALIDWMRWHYVWFDFFLCAVPVALIRRRTFNSPFPRHCFYTEWCALAHLPVVSWPILHEELSILVTSTWLASIVNVTADLRLYAVLVCILIIVQYLLQHLNFQHF